MICSELYLLILFAIIFRVDERLGKITGAGFGEQVRWLAWGPKNAAVRKRHFDMFCGAGRSVRTGLHMYASKRDLQAAAVSI
jgi:hypothetical protein